jgi:outer membrane protein TolC
MEDRSRTWGVEPAASLPLFDGGRRRASLAISEAQRRIAVETYAGTVRGALREVEDALADYQSYVVQRAALARAVVVAQQRLGLTLERYSVGASPYLDVLDSFRELFSAAVAQAQADRAGYASVVQVYRAMGGGWEPAAWAGAGPGAAAAEAAR